jgi:phosphate transport system substrate-binding protein
MRGRVAWAAAAALVFVLLAPLSCSKGGGGSKVTLTGAGATFPYPLYSKWFDAYKQKTGVQINYQSIGSGGGIQQMKAGTVDFGASDAPVPDSVLAQMPRPVLHFPTVAGAIALAYNVPELTQPLKLTPEVIAGIFLGTIKNWNDGKIAGSNPGVTLPATAIMPVHRSDGSGTTNIFTTYLSAVSPAWFSKVGKGTSVSWPVGVGGKGNDGVAGNIRQSPGSIGYVELAFAQQNNLAVAQVRNANGTFMTPSVASTTAAVRGAGPGLAADPRTPIVNSPSPDAYPIAGLTYLLIYQDMPDAAKGKALAGFLDWAMTEGEAMAEPLSYAKLPDDVIKRNHETVAKLTSGGKQLAAK